MKVNIRVIFLSVLFLTLSTLANENDLNSSADTFTPITIESSTDTPSTPPAKHIVNKPKDTIANTTVDDFEEDAFEDDDFEDDEFSDDEFSDEFEPPHKEIFDPLSGYNRVMTSFNDDLYVYVLDPVIFKGYNLLPHQVRLSVYNFFENLSYPVSLVNNILQLKFKNTGTETLRFLTNSTVGVLGLFNPAESWFGLKPHKEDFGQTLGYYGVGGGFHIVLPFFGPTNLRDLTGDFIDFYVNPIYYVDIRKYNLFQNTYQGWAAISYKEFNKMSLYTEEYNNVRQDSLDLYPFLRDLYEQHRQQQIEE